MEHIQHEVQRADKRSIYYEVGPSWLRFVGNQATGIPVLQLKLRLHPNIVEKDWRKKVEGRQRFMLMRASSRPGEFWITLAQATYDVQRCARANGISIRYNAEGKKVEHKDFEASVQLLNPPRLTGLVFRITSENGVSENTDPSTQPNLACRATNPDRLSQGILPEAEQIVEEMLFVKLKNLIDGQIVRNTPRHLWLMQWHRHIITWGGEMEDEVEVAWDITNAEG